MKSGLSLVDMARELERQANSKRDFVTDTRSLAMADDAQRMAVGPALDFGINNNAHAQIGERLAIPAKFYNRLRTEHPALLAHNVNTLFREEPEQRMVRTLDGNVRALLSNRYRPLDNFDLANAVLPVMMDHPDIRIESSQVTETRFYLKAVFPRIAGEVKRGDVVQSGIVISNSEVGSGALTVSPLIFRLVCLNGMIAADHGTRKSHVGKRVEAAEDAFEMFSDATRAADDRAFFMKVSDIVRGTLKQDVFERIVAGMRDATEQKIAGNVQEVVEVTAKRFALNESTANGVLRHLIEGGDLSRYGLMNAVTRQSQDEADYDEATRLERVGGQIIELAPSEWNVIAKAA